MSKKRNQKELLEVISIQDLIHSLGLPDEDVLRWIKRDNPKIFLDHKGHEAVSKEFLEKYSKSEEYDMAFKKAVTAERFFLNSDSLEANKKIKEHRLKLIATYDNYIHELENIHQKYIHMANSLGHESKIMAAYLLFSRAIATLKLCCLAQKHDYWYWGSLLREIDEHLALAEYFIIHGDTPAGKVDLLSGIVKIMPLRMAFAEMSFPKTCPQLMRLLVNQKIMV
jgi:hypothetical protein